MMPGTKKSMNFAFFPKTATASMETGGFFPTLSIVFSNASLMVLVMAFATLMLLLSSNTFTVAFSPVEEPCVPDMTLLVKSAEKIMAAKASPSFTCLSAAPSSPLCLTSSTARSRLEIILSDTERALCTPWSWFTTSTRTFFTSPPVSYTHLRAHETRHDLVCRLLLEKKKKKQHTTISLRKNRKKMNAIAKHQHQQ